jgi:hypothetical protein
MRPRRPCILVACALAASACTNSPDHDADPTTTATISVAEIPTTTARQPAVRTSPLRDRPLPLAVMVRDRPDGVTLGDPAFEALPGAHADFGTLGGAAYQIEMPDNWNGRLVLWMHGFEDLEPEANVSAPDLRHYLIAHGIAWGASSFSSTSLIPGRAADETAALWDFFVRKYGRPSWSYVVGASMGGWAAHIVAERYGNRFDGSLGLCGAVGTTPGVRIGAEFLVAAAFVAGVTQSDFDAAPDLADFIEQRIRGALDDPQKHTEFENILIDLTGGPRAFAREGIHLEEATNWRRAVLLATAGLAPPRDTPYQLGPGSGVTSADFNSRAIHLPRNDALVTTFTEGMEVTGNLQMPLVTLHTTGDGQVPINQAQILRRRVDAAGKGDLLVERVIKDIGHCGFSTPEQEAAFAALVNWVEGGHKPDGTNLNVDDLTSLDRTFELEPRPGTPEGDSASAAAGRAVVRGQARLDGAAFDARWIGAAVRDGGLVTPCQTTLPPIDAGHFEIAVFGNTESAGCGRAGAEILLWTFADERILFATTAVPWPDSGTATADVEFATDEPLGAAPFTTGFSGEAYGADGERVAIGSRIVASVGDTVCGVASIRSSGSFNGYSMYVVGPDSIAECRPGATLTFRVNGAPAVETAINSPDQGTNLDLTVR